MTSPEQIPQSHGEAHPHNHQQTHPLHPANSALGQTEHKIENIIRHDPNHQRMGEVYRELESLRQKDQAHFGADLRTINKKLHQDGLLPHLTIIQDRFTGPDRKEHVGYGLVADSPHNPGHRVGSEVSTSHPQVGSTPASRHYYQGMSHGNHSGYTPSRDSADSGRAAHGGYDSNLTGRLFPTGERKALIDQALELAGITITPEAEAAMNKMVIRESGWDPNIVNTWDRNAQRGDPSKGLMQVIHSTFERFRDKSLPDSQLDPLANMVAALRYMGNRYGHGNNEAGLMKVASRSGGY